MSANDSWFEVGDSIKRRMNELGDVPSRSSVWYKGADGQTYSEWGYGIRYDYRAVLLEDGWIVSTYSIGITEPEPPLNPNPTKPTGTLQAIDVSNFQSRDLTQYTNQFAIDHVIVRLFHDQESPSREHSIAQIRSAQSLDKTVGGYVWTYKGLDPRRQIESSLSIIHQLGVTIPILWIDVEPYNNVLPTLDELVRCVEACDNVDQPCGIYTGKWVWDKLGNPTVFQHLPLWHAAYGVIPSFTLASPYGGWTKCVCHQYTSTPIDRNIIQGEYTVA